MDKVNYSLLVALVDEGNANLFDDVIYHVLGYTISSMAEAYTDKKHEYSTTDVQTEIKKEVGIEIPVSIIRSTLISISKKGGDVSITFIGEKKNLFSIGRSWDTARTSYVSDKAQKLEDRKKQLESQYQIYLQNNRYVTEMTIEDFLRQNMEEALSFMKGENDTYINGEYVHVARFLSYIQGNNPRLYEVVCDIVWGAMIAGLLRDGETKVEQEEVQGVPKKTKYFLDTPIVMAALDLSRESNVSQAKDLIRVIKSSGGDILVHQLTYEEIDSILYSVIEAGAPYKQNDLAEAYARRALERTDIVLIKERLEIHLKEVGISILRLDGDELERAKSSCKEDLLRQLAKSRGQGDSYTYREVHDICLWQYVSYHAGGSRDSRKLDAYFITSNQDLIRLTKAITKANLDGSRKDCLIRPDNLILNLWIRGGITSEMKKDLLSEKITKCIVANDVDTSRRVNLVLDKYIKTGNSVTEEVAKILYQELANRPPKLMNLVDELSKDMDETEECAIKSKILTEARAKFNERSTSHDDLLKQQERLREEVEELRGKYSTIDRQLREKNVEFSRRNELLVSRGKQLETQKKLREELVTVRSQLSDIERARDTSIQTWKRWGVPILRILVALGLVFASGISIIQFIREDVQALLRSILTYLGGAALLTIFGFLVKIIFKRGAWKEYFDGCCPLSKGKYIEERRKEWTERNKEQAEKYAELMKQKEELEKKDQDIENELKSLEGAA
nr:hypothetical protein [uncultured Porphyromonas sp.]